MGEHGSSEEEGPEVSFHPVVLAFATICTVLTCLVCGYLMVQHLRNWTIPEQQKCIVRIVVMVPLYALMSMFSLYFFRYERWFGLIRDSYEAYALYMFVALCTQYAGGEEPLGQALEQMDPIRLMMPLWCTVKPGRRMLKSIKQSVLQYVILKPAISILTTLFVIVGLYAEGEWRPDRFYLYATILYNVGVSVSLYGLVLFYKVTHEELRAYKPLLKFAVIKFIVFFCYWQSILMAIISAFGMVPDLPFMTEAQIGQGFQNVLICLEMLVFAILHIVAYPVDLYRITSQSQMPLARKVQQAAGMHRGIKETLDQSDLLADTVDSFLPTFKRDDPIELAEREAKRAELRINSRTGLLDSKAEVPVHEVETIGTLQAAEDATGMVVSETVVKHLFNVGASELQRDVRHVEEYYRTFALENKPVTAAKAASLADSSDDSSRSYDLPEDHESLLVARR
eukprot:TRINITY_DN3538_c0_g2_i1.p2 TRINITY_DN3538_c0_g2~~TRINITY_DN3538_c0_g2_i1.p2  ORF type:complete len:486 (+),score=149.83 TRINITY_DN3538_c0_g2_i1:99-1460(+)